MLHSPAPRRLLQDLQGKCLPFVWAFIGAAVFGLSIVVVTALVPSSCRGTPEEESTGDALHQGPSIAPNSLHPPLVPCQGWRILL